MSDMGSLLDSVKLDKPKKTNGGHWIGRFTSAEWKPLCQRLKGIDHIEPKILKATLMNIANGSILLVPSPTGPHKLLFTKFMEKWPEFVTLTEKGKALGIYDVPDVTKSVTGK